MYEWSGFYKNHGTDRGKDATIAVGRNKLLVTIDTTQEGTALPGELETAAANDTPQNMEWPLENIDVRYNEPNDVTFVREYPGAVGAVVIPGKEAASQLDNLTGGNRHHREAPAPKFWRSRILLVFLVVIGMLVAAWWLFTPWLAGKLASKVSVETEAGFGESIFSGLNLAPDTDSAKTFLANRFFAEMNADTRYNIRVTVVNSPIENAFALPGGRIVVYTGLLSKLQSYPEFAALLAHEFSHVQLKHSTRSVFRALGSKVFLSLLAGNSGAAGSVLADQAEQLKSLGYSRTLEKEADLYGLDLLKQRKIDPAGFTGLFNQLKKDDGDGEMPEMMASHPNLDERIRYVNAAAGNNPVVTDSILQTIFLDLKK